MRPMRALGIGGALAIGAALRFQQIADQILADDEWHALHALHLRRWEWIASHFGEADHSIPLTLVYKALASTLGLSEIVMRAPMLLCGLLAVVVLPLLVADDVGEAASVVFAWLLAIAPLHVYFSRYARPYAITMLLACVAALAFQRWWTRRGRGWAATYALCAVAAVSLHLAVAPFVLVPIALTAIGAPRAWRALVPPATAVVLGLGLALAAPLTADREALARKIGAGAVTRATLAGAAQLFAGTANMRLVALVGVLAVLGAAVTVARRRAFGASFVALAACQVGAAFAAAPAGLVHPIVVVRYMLPVLPLVLLWVAIGIHALARRALPAAALGIALAALLFAGGPLPALCRRPNDWTNHALFQYAYDPESPYAYQRMLAPERVSGFYSRLAQEPPETLLVVEAPWYYAWDENLYPYVQAVHRQRMRVGFVAPQDRFARLGELPQGSGMRFRNAIHVGDRAELARQDVRYVIFHKDLKAELRGRPREAVDVSNWIHSYADAYGAPAFEDDLVVVFDIGGRAF
jgi:hypothetical protein